MNNSPQLIHLLNDSLHLDLNAETAESQLQYQLSLLIEKMMQDDFDGLVQILYKVDVSESKIKDDLRKNEGANAASVIANLILERLQEKLETRRKFSADPLRPKARFDEINPEEERW
jgi:hypothetical protein